MEAREGENEVREAVLAVSREAVVGPDERLHALELLLQIVSNLVDPPVPPQEAEAARSRYGRLKVASGPFRRTLAPLPSAVTFGPLPPTDREEAETLGLALCAGGILAHGGVRAEGGRVPGAPHL